MASTLPPDLFDHTTLISLFSVLVILGAAYLVSQRVLSPTTRPAYRFLFIWHAFDALIHFFFEGSFLYHCFFSSASRSTVSNAYPNPSNYLGYSDRFVHGAQAGGLNPFAQLWMVYAKADKRWAGVDLGVVSLELLTVLVVGPMAVWVCRDIAKGKQRVNITMVILATAELYGGEFIRLLTSCVWVDRLNVAGCDKQAS
jgi:hypothetical protein